MSNQNFNPTSISEEELKAQFAQKSLFSFSGYLARKGSDKSYTEEKKKAYWFNWMGFLLGNLLRISAGFMTLFLFLKGVFGIGGSFAGTIAAVITFSVLAGLEYRQINNATQLFERWFFKGVLSRSNVGFALLFSGATLCLALWGIGDTVKALSSNVAPFKFSEVDVNPTLVDDINKQEKEAADFKKSRSWKGKLDPKDGRTHAKMVVKAQSMRDTLRAEIAMAKLSAKSAYELQLSQKSKKDGDNTFYAILLILLSEFIFWFCFYHKEHYEFLAYHEARLAGKIGAPMPAGKSPTPRPAVKLGDTDPDFAKNGHEYANFQ